MDPFEDALAWHGGHMMDPYSRGPVILEFKHQSKVKVFNFNHSFVLKFKV